MKKLFFLAIIASIALTSCNNELDINAPHKDITVVYSTLNKDDATNWVRIQRGYLGNEGITGGNQSPDSIFYKNLTVSIEEIDDNGNVVSTWPLIKDDSPAVQDSVESGFFTTEGFHLFRLEQPLDYNKSYRLNILKPDGEGSITSAVTRLVADYKVTTPKGSQKITFGTKGQDFIWDEAENAILYQAFLSFHYVEVNVNNPADSTPRTIDYVLPTSNGKGLDGSSEIRNNLSYEVFYNFLGNAIPVDESKIRFFRGMDIHVVAAAEDLATYILVSQPAQGIVQDKPDFTNVENGIGVFSSIGRTEKTGMLLSTPYLDSLIAGVFTCPLNFAKASGSDTCQCIVPGQMICN